MLVAYGDMAYVMTETRKDEKYPWQRRQRIDGGRSSEKYKVQKPGPWKWKRRRKRIGVAGGAAGERRQRPGGWGRGEKEVGDQNSQTATKVFGPPPVGSGALIQDVMDAGDNALSSIPVRSTGPNNTARYPLIHCTPIYSFAPPRSGFVARPPRTLHL